MTTSRRRAQRQSGVMPNPDPDPDHEPELEPIEQEGVMPDPPSNWPPISTTTNSMLNHTSSRESQQVQEEQLAAPSSGSVESSRTRGPTLMHSGWGEDGGTLHITVNRLGQPILKQASRLASNLGVLARNGILAPLTYVDWRIVPAHIKNNIWAHIKENTDATDRMRDYLMMSFSRKWKEWKAIAKREGYTPYTTTQERLTHRPQRVEERQWRRLVHYWDSEKAKLKSVRNKASRALLTMPHTSGRKSLPQVREELTQQNNGVEPTRREVYKTTHTKKDGNASSEAAARAIKDMENLHAQHPESPEVGFIRNDIYGQVMGPERHGRVRTLGLGPTPSNIFGSSHRQFEIERRDTELRHQQELERMRVQMEAENEKIKANMEAEIQRVRDEMTLQMQQNERNRAEIEEMKEKDSATQVEIETMQAQMRELLAHIRNPGVSVQSPQDISSATGQVPDALSGENRMQRQTEDRATKRQQVITQNQLLNYREERIAKKRKQY